MQAKDNKMEHIGKIVAYLILAINAFFVGTLILSAYSPYLNPKLNPLSSGLGLAFPLFLVINIAFIIFWCALFIICIIRKLHQGGLNPLNHGLRRAGSPKGGVFLP